MNTTTALKLGQVAGVLLMGAGVAAHLLPADNPRVASQLLLAGAVAYAGCRLATWLRKPG